MNDTTNGPEITLLGAKVTPDFHTKVRVQAALGGGNISDYLRDLVARDLGFSSYAEAVHNGEARAAHRSEAEPLPAA